MRVTIDATSRDSDTLSAIYRAYISASHIRWHPKIILNYCLRFRYFVSFETNWDKVTILNPILKLYLDSW